MNETVKKEKGQTEAFCNTNGVPNKWLKSRNESRTEGIPSKEGKECVINLNNEPTDRQRIREGREQTN